MKLLINLCSHDGIVSHYNGVGTMTKRYIYAITKILDDKKIDYHMNLFTPRYNKNSFGYNKSIFDVHNSLSNTNIYMVENGSNGEINYGVVENWITLCKNTAKIINKIDTSNYDIILTIYNDTPFACLSSYLNNSINHYKLLILHSTVKIHKVDSAVENSILLYDKRLSWEMEAINYINVDKNSYFGYIGNFIFDHLVREYGLKKKKGIKIFNGEILNDYLNNEFSEESIRLFQKIKNYQELIISFGRAEEYKNLTSAFELGKVMNIPTLVIAQLYYAGQPIEKDYRQSAIENNGLLFINPPFDLAKYILRNFDNKLICLVPSKKEIMGLIVNEVRKINRDNILVVANNVDGLKEQINDGLDGVLVDLDDLIASKNKINYYFSLNKMKKMRENGLKIIEEKYDIIKNVKKVLEYFIEKEG